MPSYQTHLTTAYKAFFTPIWLHSTIAASTLLLLLTGFYMEYAMGLEPCPLCMMQRIVFFCIGMFSLVSALHRSSTKCTKAYIYTIVLFGIIGSSLAIRQLYLQNLPEDKLPECLPGLSYMISAFPLQEVLKAMIMGSGECGDVLWRFLGLSIPGWTLVAFISITLANILLLVNIKLHKE